MTVDLERQIRDYASHVTELSTPVDVERVRLESPAEARRVPRYRRFEARWAAGLAAAAVILALIGGLALGYQLLAADEPPVITEPAPTPSTSLPAPTTSLPSPTTLVDPGVAPLMTWERVPPQASLGAGDDDHEYVMHTVIEGGPGLIAAGRVRTAGGIYWYDMPTVGDQAAVWMSEDGVSWDRIPADGSGLDGPGGYSIHDLAAGGPGYVAVGAAIEDGYNGPAVWVSENALVWTRVDSAGFATGDEMNAVAASDDGIVAVGARNIWFSSDGWDWQQVDSPPSRRFSDVARADWGFVAAGETYEEVQDDRGDVIGTKEGPIAATSRDGVIWEYFDLPEADTWFGAEVTAIAATDEEVVVGGNYRTNGNLGGGITNMPPAFWTSTSGSDWDLSYIPLLPVGGIPNASAGIRSLAITDSGTVAVGGWWPPLVYQMRPFWTSPGWTDEVRNAVWVSPTPGEPWREDPPAGAFALEELDSQIGTTMGFDDVAVLDGLLVGVSTHAGEAVVWIGEWTD